MSIINLPVKFGKGHIENTLQKIGETDTSAYAYFGYDPANNTGVIIANGKIASSKILDIKVSEDDIDEAVDGAQKITVVYVDAVAKAKATMSFNVISQAGVDKMLDVYKKRIDDLSTLIDDVSFRQAKNAKSIQQNINDIYQQVASLQLSNDTYDASIQAINSSIDDLYGQIKNINTTGGGGNSGGGSGISSQDAENINSSIAELRDLISNINIDETPIIKTINASISYMDSSINDLYQKLSSGTALLYWIDSDY